MMRMHMQKNVKTPKDNFTLCFSVLVPGNDVITICTSDGNSKMH